ncbi:hypothetical protein HC928_11595 [bacterium]|nr:hypothetical protein [bacterium]
MWDLFDAAGKAVRGLVDDVTEYETTSTYRSSSIEKAIEILDNVPGMTPCRTSLFKHSYFKFSLQMVVKSGLGLIEQSVATMFFSRSRW